MTFARRRGARKVVDVEKATKGFLLRLSCGHELQRKKRPDPQSTAVCPTCRKATAGQPVVPVGDKEALGALREWRRANGLCPTHGVPAVPGRISCERCLSRSS